MWWWADMLLDDDECDELLVEENALANTIVDVELRRGV